MVGKELLNTGVIIGVIFAYFELVSFGVLIPLNRIAFGSNNITLPQWIFIFLVIAGIAAIILQFAGKNLGLKDTIVETTKESGKFLKNVSGMKESDYAKLQTQAKTNATDKVTSSLKSRFSRKKVGVVIPSAADVMANLRTQYYQQNKKLSVMATTTEKSMESINLPYIAGVLDKASDFETKKRFMTRSLLLFFGVVAIAVALYLYAYLYGGI
jgi:hypothetical protein